MIQFRCDCGKLLQAREEHAGQVTACPTCGKQLTIPDPEAIKGAPPRGVRQAPPAAAPLPDDDYEPRPSRRPRRDDEFDDFDRRPAAPEQTSGKAIASLILGLGSFCLPLVVTNIVGIVLGFLAISEANRSRGRVGGKGLAVAGIVCSFLSLGMLGLIILLFPAIAQVRTAAARSEDANNLKQIGLAFHIYQDNHRQMPPAVVFNQDGRPLYSWRVLLLPYLEQDHLYQQFRLDEAWDSPHNIQFLKRMPKIYAHPQDPSAGRDGMTHYQVFTTFGNNPGNVRTIFRSDKFGWRQLDVGFGGRPVFGSESLAIGAIPDGASNTILITTAATPVHWTRPDDVPYTRSGPTPRFCELFGNTCNVAFADGSVRPLDLRRLHDEAVRAAITANDGKVVPLD